MCIHTLFQQTSEASFRVVKVLDHKEAKGGFKAAVPFMADEYCWLQDFVQLFRPLLCTDPNLRNVFPVLKHYNYTVDKELSYGSLYNILSQFKSRSGVKLSSRNIRRARITNTRDNNISPASKKKLAKAMNHTLETAERYYNFEDENNSVAAALEVTSTPIKGTAARGDRLPPPQMSPLPDAPQPSTSRGRKRNSVVEADVTLKTLRSKKIKSRKAK